MGKTGVHAKHLASHLRRHTVNFAIESLVLIALWLLLVGKLNWGEALEAILAAILGAIAAELLRGEGFTKFSPRLQWLAQVWRLPGYFVTGSWAILLELFETSVLRSKPKSRFRSIPFNDGGNDARSAARRVLALIYINSAPDSIVINIDLQRDRMLVHQVRTSDTPGVAWVLGAR